MYLAELHGKLSSKIERMEDILTSNVFSFFKYSTREIFLKGYLNELGFEISAREAREAQFLFWPRFEENTEPDLVILIGDYYLLIEAKYFSEFGGETEKTKSQLIRELEGGKLEARNYGKQFKLIAITADYYYKKEKFQIIPPEFTHLFKWTNWQSVALFLESVLQSTHRITEQERGFVSDLCLLLDKKNLRGFQGFGILNAARSSIRAYPSVFFEPRTAKFRGDFIGFIEALSTDKKIKPTEGPVFLDRDKELFASLRNTTRLEHPSFKIFYKGGE